MASPKKKVSRSRRDKRRYHPTKALSATQVTKCPQCSELVRPHRICKCGSYKGTQVLTA